MKARTNWLAAALIAPLLLLILGAFLLPVGVTLGTALRDPEVATTLPQTRAALLRWDGRDLPEEAAFAAIARELAAALEERRIGNLAARLNFERTGMRTLLLRVARAGDNLQAPFRPALIALDPRWGEAETWRLIQRAGGPVTSLYLLRAIDMTRTPAGEIRAVDPDQAVYRTLFWRTMSVSVIVTLTCVLLAYPVAATIARLSPPWSSIALTLVLIPFWSSVMVRSTAWFALLSREGPINDALVMLGILDAPMQLVGTRFAVLIATIHVLLPVAILPMVGVMTRLDRRYLKAQGDIAQPSAFIGLAGPYSFDPTTWPSTKDIFVKAASADAARPAAFASKAAPPMLLMHGLDDETVQLWNLRTLADALKAKGSPVETAEFESIGHIGIVLAISRLLRWRAPVLDKMADFIRRNASCPQKRN